MNNLHISIIFFQLSKFQWWCVREGEEWPNQNSRKITTPSAQEKYEKSPDRGGCFGGGPSRIQPKRNTIFSIPGTMFRAPDVAYELMVKVRNILLSNFISLLYLSICVF